MHREGYLLVAESDHFLGRMVRTAAELDGYQVLVAIDGPTAIRDAMAQPLVAAIVDEHIRPPSEQRLGQILRRVRPRIPLVLLTGQDLTIESRARLRRVYDAIFSKPFDVFVLLQFVDQTVSSRAASQ